MTNEEKFKALRDAIRDIERELGELSDRDREVVESCVRIFGSGGGEDQGPYNHAYDIGWEEALVAAKNAAIEAINMESEL